MNVRNVPKVDKEYYDNTFPEGPEHLDEDDESYGFCNFLSFRAFLVFVNISLQDTFVQTVSQMPVAFNSDFR